MITLELKKHEKYQFKWGPNISKMTDKEKYTLRNITVTIKIQRKHSKSLEENRSFTKE